MNGRTALEQFLRTDPRDVGCDEAMAVLHVYVDLVAAGEPAAEQFPGVAAHLGACGPCGTDFEGLLAAVRDILRTRDQPRAPVSTAPGRSLTPCP